MSIVVAHGYSMMYAYSRQQQDTPSGPLANEVVPTPFTAATFTSGAVPASKRELDERYTTADDFDVTSLADAGGPLAWDDAWPDVYWVKAGSRYYTWDREAWVTAPLTTGFVLDPIPGVSGDEDERLFVGRYPQTKAELDSITPTADDGEGGTVTAGYFPTGHYVRLVGAASTADQYFWNGSAWLPGVSDD